MEFTPSLEQWPVSLIVELLKSLARQYVAGVTAQVVRDTDWGNGFLGEDTRDWYAQDMDGNVWYLGESTTEHDLEG